MTTQTTPPPTQSRRSPLRTVLILIALFGAIGAVLAAIAHEQSLGGGSLLHYALRVLLIVLGLSVWFFTQSLIGSRACPDGCILDVVHQLTEPANAWLHLNPKVANRILIASSAGIDSFGVFMLVWSVFGPSLHPFVALLTLFIMRQACQATTALPSPPGVIWRNPGFPSLLVTYHVGNDYFFSGHTAIALLGAVELWRFSLWLGVAGTVVALGEIIVVLILRMHYTMDVLAALVATGCAVALTNWLL